MFAKLLYASHSRHFVADAVHREDPGRLVRVVFDLGAEPADVRVDSAQVDRLVLPPYQPEDVLHGECPCTRPLN